MRRKVIIAVGVVVVFFAAVMTYRWVIPPFGSRATVSFLGYTQNSNGKLAVFQLMNHSKKQLAVLPKSFFLDAIPGGLVEYTNVRPEIYGDVPPGILQPQTSATFAVQPPPGTNSWCFEMQCVEFRRVQGWELPVRRVLRKTGLPWLPHKSYYLRTPELPAVTNSTASATP